MTIASLRLSSMHSAIVLTDSAPNSFPLPCTNAYASTMKRIPPCASSNSGIGLR